MEKEKKQNKTPEDEASLLFSQLLHQYEEFTLLTRPIKGNTNTWSSNATVPVFILPSAWHVNGSAMC